MPGGIPDLHAFSPACNGFLRFTSGVTPADLLVANMRTKSFRKSTCRSHIHKYLWGSNPRLSVPQHNALNYLSYLLFSPYPDHARNSQFIFHVRVRNPSSAASQIIAALASSNSVFPAKPEKIGSMGPVLI